DNKSAESNAQPAASNSQPAPAAVASTVATVPVSNTTAGNATPVPAVEKSATPATISPAPLSSILGDGGARLYLLSGQKEMRVGEKQRLMLLVQTATPLGLAAATLKFDPRYVAVRGVTQGSLFGEAKDATPVITPSIDPRGSLLALIAPQAAAPINGMGVLLFVEVEAVAAGESDVTLDQAGVHLMSVSGQNVASQLAHTHLTVKQ
ncbi:MAG TPA: hypothetical protein VJT82_09105, partial [Pyrinomonadaceae bacterium]|nr:hypothetical protein [Pyrinomonadaceae bacterium]